MSELISGKEAKQAWANGKTVQIKNNIVGEDFYDLTGDNAKLGVFDLDFYNFRIKPRTITLNGIELNPCYALGIDRIKNEVSIQLKDESDAEILHDLLARLYGFKG